MASVPGGGPGGETGRNAVSHDEPASIEVPSAAELAEMDESVLSAAVRRFHSESAEAKDPIAAFGAFNQHGSSPW